MDNAIFDEAKGVYRVNHSDGSFDTYTPGQFRELTTKTKEVPIVEDLNKFQEKETIKVVVTQQVLDENPVLVEEGLKVGDIGIASADGVDFSDKTTGDAPVNTVSTTGDAVEADITNEVSTQI